MPRLLAALVAVALFAPAAAADPTYWQDVRPILRKHCTVCHAERKLGEVEVSAGLALDKPELIRAGGKGGKIAVLVPGKPDESLLVTLLTTKDKKRAMPLDADPLPAADIATLRRWVELGGPEGVSPKDADTVAAANPAAAAKVRRLPVTFATKAALPKAAGLPGPIDFTLPVGPLPPVAAVAFSPDGKLLATGTYGRVTVWELVAARPAKVLTNVLGAVNDLRFSPDGKLLAVAGGQPSARGDLRLFSAADWSLVASLGGHLDTVSGVAWAPDGKRLASASFDKTVRLWDVADPKAPKVLHTFTGHSDFVYAVAFSPKGDWYATASKDRTGRMVDAATGKSQFTFSGMNDEVLAVAVRPDGSQVITSGLEPPLRFWDTKTAEKTRQAGGPGGGTHEIALDPAGKLAAAAGADGTVRLYNPAAGDQLKAVQTGSPVFAVAIDPAAKRIASGGADGLVKL
ncbi:MAG TPA: c-type cytochrome domain-containing protein, partial [Urbifossiella sp.]|nr:c-type cytochrome domain-containing protein [Urbifossiella sp.]